ncbi:MAG: hypothetical protein QNJ45_03740 [Ardenticatenaceae bacterium]|nr:hypothetical protein [Ardenticatenaceae bacterium]
MIAQLSTTADILKRQPAVWGFAFLSAIVLEFSQTAAPLPFNLPADPTSFAEINQLIGEIEALGGNPAALARWGFSIFALLVGVWVVTALNQAGLIHAAAEMVQKKKTSLIGGWRFGFKKLIPLVVIDTIVLFPIFLLTLLIIIDLVAILLSLVFDSGGMAGRVNWGTVTAGLCLIPLLVIYPFAGAATALYRAIAIRLALVGGHPARSAIKAVRPLLRQQWRSLLVTGMVTLVLLAAFSTAGGLFDSLAGALSASWLQVIFQTIFAAVRIALLSILWTVTVIDLQSPSLGIKN